MLLLNLYFTIIYLYSFFIANKKANEANGWNLELVVTTLIMPFVFPIILFIEIHTFFMQKSRL
jgi:cell shape-determining protein MreD